MFGLSVYGLTLAGGQAEAVTSGGISYVYDELGRLLAVVDPATETARYTYDALGNLLSISRQISTVVSVIEFTPNGGPVGATVRIYGTGFSATPSENTVKVDGVLATVTSASPTELVTSVPASATSGTISVATPNGSASSGAPFNVMGPIAPTITGFSPTIGTTGTAVTMTGVNFEATPANNRVTFNVMHATVSSASTTTIATGVPPAARLPTAQQTSILRAESRSERARPPPSAPPTRSA